MNGSSLAAYHPGRVYDLPAELAEYMIAEGYALLEMRREGAAAPGSRERRRAARSVNDASRKDRRVR